MAAFRDHSVDILDLPFFGSHIKSSPSKHTAMLLKIHNNRLSDMVTIGSTCYFLVAQASTQPLKLLANS